ncbi:MAG: hypothetical protein M1823_000943 [Watsoniomyces obsoletus]|nr:MAG: hypothetical protein M1823_000943 [Watsoniomyces obsoletus]
MRVAHLILLWPVVHTIARPLPQAAEPTYPSGLYDLNADPSQPAATTDEPEDAGWGDVTGAVAALAAAGWMRKNYDPWGKGLNPLNSFKGGKTGAKGGFSLNPFQLLKKGKGKTTAAPTEPVAPPSTPEMPAGLDPGTVNPGQTQPYKIPDAKSLPRLTLKELEATMTETERDFAKGCRERKIISDHYNDGTKNAPARTRPIRPKVAGLPKEERTRLAAIFFAEMKVYRKYLETSLDFYKSECLKLVQDRRKMTKLPAKQGEVRQKTGQTRQAPVDVEALLKDFQQKSAALPSQFQAAAASGGNSFMSSLQSGAMTSAVVNGIRSAARSAQRAPVKIGA